MRLELHPVFKFTSLSKDSTNNLNDNDVGYIDSFWTIKGRLRRRVYFVRILALAMLSFSLVGYMNTLNVIESPGVSFPFAVSSILVITVTIAQFITAVKRAHDINHPGWYLIAAVGTFFFGYILLVFTRLWLNGFLPIIQVAPLLIYGILLFLKDGTPGPNKYGEDPKGRDQKLSKYIKNTTA